MSVVKIINIVSYTTLTVSALIVVATGAWLVANYVFSLFRK